LALSGCPDFGTLLAQATGEMPGERRDVGSVESEREFYRRLLDLGGKAELEPLLSDALR